MPFTQRQSGILLPVFSLRSRDDFGVGDFGGFDGLFAWMQKAKQEVLMVLPLLPTAPGDPSPYSTRSAFGLNPLFIDIPPLLSEWGIPLSDDERKQLAEARAAERVRYDLVFPLKRAVLERCCEVFFRTGKSDQLAQFARFQQDEAVWLRDFALFTALSVEHGDRAFWEWPEPLAKRDPAALEEAAKRLARQIRTEEWLQWVAHRQWERVREQAKARGVLLCGDEPFIIGQNSADCWVHPHQLRRDAKLGVPPDDFSADGQDWGLPWFDFAAMEADDYRWLRARAKHAASTYDLRRVDHAIGYFRQYIRDEKTPKGRFVPDQEPAQRALGEKHFKLLSEGTGIVAEDLGVIPKFAREVLNALQLPGYKVMRWAREDGVYQHPHHYQPISLATTGTHDTETLRDWWEKAPQWERDACATTFPELQRFRPAPAQWSPELHQALLEAALQSGSNLVIFPWQDVFAEVERTNVPGTMGDHNWSYRMKPSVEDLLTREDTARAATWLDGLTRAGRR